MREVGPISYEARPSASFHASPTRVVNRFTCSRVQGSGETTDAVSCLRGDEGRRRRVLPVSKETCRGRRGAEPNAI